MQGARPPAQSSLRSGHLGPICSRSSSLYKGVDLSGRVEHLHICSPASAVDSTEYRPDAPDQPIHPGSMAMSCAVNLHRIIRKSLNLLWVQGQIVLLIQWSAAGQHPSIRPLGESQNIELQI
eukprot:12414247-Karenia_brevis.AAC.1